MPAAPDNDGWIAGEAPEDGAIRRIGEDRYEFRIHRDIPRPVEKVWAALTIPERLADWLGPRADLDLRVGGRYFVWFDPTDDDAVRGIITEYDPPRLLAYVWNDADVRWAIEPTAAGSRLTLTTRNAVGVESGVNAWWLLGGSAGWHAMMDELAFAITQDAKADFGSNYEDVLIPRYKRHFGPHVPGFDTPPALRHQEPDGLVTEAGQGLYNIHFMRRFMLPIEKVWAALTEPARLADWFAKTRVDLRVGGEIDFRWESHGHEGRAVIVALDPPNLIAWATPGPNGLHSVVRIELKQEVWMKGTRLILTQTLMPPEHLLSIATGWHVHLHDLADAAARETPLPWSLERERQRGARELAEHVPRYRSKLPKAAAEVPWTH